jgi:hypothetical protein
VRATPFFPLTRVGSNSSFGCHSQLAFAFEMTASRLPPSPGIEPDGEHSHLLFDKGPRLHEMSHVGLGSTQVDVRTSSPLAPEGCLRGTKTMLLTDQRDANRKSGRALIVIFADDREYGLAAGSPAPRSLPRMSSLLTASLA